ncbi:uncharacterized protein KY384_003411 [Bacidia gigantensis]|uniref:uncharacterized protein n=1 Tax=Bacidia gigantensis TaxID=2732470 RepID=UPI001D039093|nr:uncharacterized protein KY384_003411 [Bacidia gigantensis]KAG8531775.1 hypothetical protein KY384_003411 [Bacidia gigantensis]
MKDDLFKSKRECPGYDRGNGTIVFENETPTSAQPAPESKDNKSSTAVKSGTSSTGSFEAAPKKVTAKNKTPRKKASTDTIEIPRTGEDHQDKPFDMMLVKPDANEVIVANDFIQFGLPQDPEQQSVAFFMSNFAFRAEQSEEIWGGCLSALPTFLEQASPKSPLAAAAATTSMAAIAWSPGGEEFRKQSLSRYVTSLKRINDALKDPKQAKSDNLLMAVLILGFYECDPEPFEDFLSVTEGTIPDDFVPSCADRLVMLTKDIPHLRRREKQLAEEPDQVARRTQAEALLADAQDTDVLLDFWASMMPQEFQFTSFKLPVVDDKKAKDMYPSSMDVYYDHTMASTWNTWRITRIRVLQIIMNCADTINPPIKNTPHAYEYETSLDTLKGLTNDICASVPFHLGHHEAYSSEKNAFNSYPHPPGQANWPENFAASGAVGGWLMMQPLAFVSRLECIPQSQRLWVREYLTTFMRDSRDMSRISPPPKSPTSPT